MGASHRTLKHACLTLSLVVLSGVCNAENLWQGKRAAISLTYDDSLNVHLDKVVPALNRHDMKGTFYLTINVPPLAERLNEWRQVAEQGHELGNHTLFHPCNGQGAGREWVAAERDLSQWTAQRMVDNIKVANTTLQAIDGKTERTLAFPCGDTSAGGESYVDAIKPLFVGARGVHASYPTPDQVAQYNIAAHMINGQSIGQLQTMVDNAIANQGLLVFLFHGVGGEHGLNLDEPTHLKLLNYLSNKQSDLWIAPMVDIAQFIDQQE
ncbi:polysaccharide deacetylase family protein [Gilvimarinus sp. SDUM040013]|uniref:Polysaccharide deacetylase family protein n=1 Tax=Gilvimarinus gilvus TaxID=3058038 RepID=A0ABU4S3X6_9GAMM|nr:polysaccharide deacetylase family protein [Gilvimarinus sp. SDUM040013]MDO3385457.1 polysaccharide deacetylase family protein [Gilvimarinus sp. SDUM040013]MDX6851126.1 polysaccharide deacetylase family protein [Gilvimarinus sp. SDUM040013]